MIYNIIRKEPRKENGGRLGAGPEGGSNTRFRALPCALLLATNCGFLDLLLEHPFCLMDSPAPPPGQVRPTQVGGGEIPVLTTMKTSEQSPIKGMKNTEKPSYKRSVNVGSFYYEVKVFTS